MYLTPAHSLLLRKARPEVKVLDVRDDITDLTTYTFSAVNIGDLGMSPIASQAQFNTLPMLRSTSNRAVFINVHSEAAAITWTVTTCTLGGVAGLKTVDRGGATNAINTAQFVWSADQLQSIANTDVVVTFSKAITSCAIGVLGVENYTFLRSSAIGTASSTGTGAISVGGSSTSVENGISNIAAILATTCATGGGTEQLSLSPYSGASGDGSWAPMLLYSGSNAEIDFAGAWTFQPGIGLGPSTSVFTPGFTLDWTGAGAFDACCSSIM